MTTSIQEIGENIKNSKEFEGTILFNEPLAEKTTIKIGGNAALFVEPANVRSALIALLMLHKAEAPVFFLGGGSNLVISDEGISKVVVSTKRLTNIRIKPHSALPFELEDFPLVKEACPVTVTAESGTTIEELMAWCTKYALTGLEQFAGLPGTCGGAAFMNARCYQKDFSSIIETVRYADFSTLPLVDDFFDIDTDSLIQTYTFSKDDWDYKKSPFQHKNVLILDVSLSLTCIDIYSTAGQVSPAFFDYIKNKAASFVKDREEKGQFKLPSAGSVFKNNHEFGKPSGKLIDEAGLKGTKRGGAQIAPWHGNFIVNNGGATAQDVKALVELAQKEVQEGTGFLLEPEIIFV